MDLYEIEEHIGTMIPEGELPSETDLNENRAATAKWIQKNSPQQPPSKSTLKQGSKEKPNKSPISNRQSGKGPKDSSREVYNRPKTVAKQTNSRPPAEPVKETLRANSPVAPAIQQKVQTSRDPIIMNADVGTPAPTEKKPWLKQLWQRIFNDQT